ncbi:MAG: hypothetical protein PHW04_08350 [Candidatus Wallbacteria bacterium]|nr:hypothetical protein [Candidatus Wallbacteria bacterium]
MDNKIDRHFIAVPPEILDLMDILQSMTFKLIKKYPERYDAVKNLPLFKESYSEINKGFKFLKPYLTRITSFVTDGLFFLVQKPVVVSEAFEFVEFAKHVIQTLLKPSLLQSISELPAAVAEKKQLLRILEILEKELLIFKPCPELEIDLSACLNSLKTAGKWTPDIFSAALEETAGRIRSRQFENSPA